MDQEIQPDAQAAPSPADEAQQTQIPDGQGAEPSTASESTQPTTEQTVAQSPAGSTPPHQNIVAEAVRKATEAMLPMMREQIRAEMSGFQTQTGQKPEIKYQGKYSAEQLETILRHPDASEQEKFFATRGLAYIDARQDTAAEIQSSQQRQLMETREQQAFQGIIKDYPDVFDRSAGRWNFSSPLFQSAMTIYQSEPLLKQYGNAGIRVALDRAFADQARTSQAQTRKKQVELTTRQRAIDRNQAGAMNAGNLTPVKNQGSDTNHAKVMEAYKQNPDDPALRTAALGKFIPKSWLQ